MKIVPICKAQYKAVKAMVEAKKISNDTPCRLVRADITIDERGVRFELEKDPSDQRALIYIYTSTQAAGNAMSRGSAPEDAVPNAVMLTSNEARHITESGRVKRVHPPFSEAVGIRRIDATILTDGEATWNEALLELDPGASFRVVRGGDVRDLVPEFLVTWNGFRLRTVVPERYRSRMDEARPAP
jgi:hypothetical protein